jgi:hypothetical protein
MAFAVRFFGILRFKYLFNNDFLSWCPGRFSVFIGMPKRPFF